MAVASRGLADRDGDRNAGHLLAHLRPIDQAQMAVEILDQRGAAFDPVAVIAVENTVDLADLGAMDVSAHHGVDVALGSGLGIVVLDSGTQSTVSVDAALIPTYLTATAILTFPAISTGACSSELTIGLTGANSGDSVAPGWPPSMPQGVLGMMRVSSAGVVGVRICNFSGSAVTPPADTFRATVVRSL